MKSNVQEFGKDNNLIHEAVVTGRSVGAGRDFWSKLAHDSMLFKIVLAVVNGETTVIYDKHKIDTSISDEDLVVQWFGDSRLKMYEGTHVSHGTLTWDPSKVQLVDPLANNVGVDLNYKVAVDLFDKPFLIPESWWGKRVVFKGTSFHLAGAGPNFSFRKWLALDLTRNGFVLFTTVTVGSSQGYYAAQLVTFF